MGAIKLGAIAATLFVVALVNDWSTPDALILTMVAVLLVAWVWSRLVLQRLGFSRSLSLDRVRAGEVITEELRITNYAILPKLAVEVRDYSSLPNHHAGRVANLGPHGIVEWTTTSMCGRRGRYRLGPVVVAGGDPIGLFQVRRSIPASHELLVYPPAVDVSRCHFPAANLTGGPTTNRMMALSAHTISGLREYAPGDPLNRISWSATARTGTMMVKEFDPDPTSDMWILVDLTEDGIRTLEHERGYGTWDDVGHLKVHPVDTTEEYVIAIAGSLAERALNEGRKVGLLVNRALPMRIDPDTGQRQWLKIFETLAVASSFGSRSIGEAIAVDAMRFSRSSGLFIVTASPAHEWIPPAAALMMRQVPLTAAIVTAGTTTTNAHETLVSGLLAARVHVAAFGDDDVNALHPARMSVLPT